MCGAARRAWSVCACTKRPNILLASRAYDSMWAVRQLDRASGSDGVREFEQVLAWLRALAWSCAPPIGVGEFDILYANAAEVVVWYSPARDGHRPGEVIIPCARLEAAWNALREGRPLDEARLCELGGHAAMGRWLLAILALLPGVRVEASPLALILDVPTEPQAKDAESESATRSGGKRARRKRSVPVAQGEVSGDASHITPSESVRN